MCGSCTLLLRRTFRSIITVGEIAAGFDNVEVVLKTTSRLDARNFFARIPLLRLSMETVYECAKVDQELRGIGKRLGENGNRP